MINNMKTIAITMDEDTLLRMDKLTTGNRSGIVRAAVREYLSRIESKAEEERERKIFKQHRSRLARQTNALVKEQTRR